MSCQKTCKNSSIKCNSSSIKYIGICDSNSLPKNPVYFKQLTVNEMVTIPCQKPDVEDIISVMAQAEIECAKVISTPSGTTAEGQILLGSKLIMELIIKQKIIYVADIETQPVHAAHFEYNTSVFVVVPPEINGKPIEDLLDLRKIIITPYIEDIFASLQDKRNICKSLTILVDVAFVN